MIYLIAYTPILSVKDEVYSLNLFISVEYVVVKAVAHTVFIGDC